VVRHTLRYAESLRLFFVLVLAVLSCIASDFSEVRSDNTSRVLYSSGKRPVGQTSKSRANTDWGASPLAPEILLTIHFATWYTPVPPTENAGLVARFQPTPIRSWSSIRNPVPSLRSFPTGSAPYRLALSANGKYLWLALDHDQAIQRIDLEKRKLEFTVALADIFADVPGAAVAHIFGSRLFPVRACNRT
jgi:hypothetical protein